MLKLSNETVMRFSEDETKAKYIKSHALHLRMQIKKTSKRTGYSITEISQQLSPKKSKTYLDNLTSFKRFKKQGDIHNVTFDSMIKKMVAITSK